MVKLLAGAFETLTDSLGSLLYKDQTSVRRVSIGQAFNSDLVDLPPLQFRTLGRWDNFSASGKRLRQLRFLFISS